MKVHLILIVGVWAVTGAVYAVVTALSAHGSSDQELFAYIGPAIVITAAVSSDAFRRRREARTRSAEPDSLEKALAARAAAAVMVDAIVGGCVLGAALLFARSVPAPLALFALVVAMLIDYYVRYAALTHSVARDR